MKDSYRTGDNAESGRFVKDLVLRIFTFGGKRKGKLLKNLGLGLFVEWVAGWVFTFGKLAITLYIGAWAIGGLDPFKATYNVAHCVQTRCWVVEGIRETKGLPPYNPDEYYSDPRRH
jgi:hypothetical protein